MQKLQKKLALLEMDIGVHQEQIAALSSEATGFTAAGHFDSGAIMDALEQLVARYQGLQVRHGVGLCTRPASIILDDHVVMFFNK